MTNKSSFGKITRVMPETRIALRVNVALSAIDILSCDRTGNNLKTTTSVNSRVVKIMVKIRLNRMGAKRQPFYRIVVADSRSPRDGRFIEIVGNYDPTKDPAIINVDEEKVMAWIKNGAQPTDTVRSLLSKQGIMKKIHQERKSKN